MDAHAHMGKVIWGCCDGRDASQVKFVVGLDKRGRVRVRVVFAVV